MPLQVVHRPPQDIVGFPFEFWGGMGAAFGQWQQGRIHTVGTLVITEVLGDELDVGGRECGALGLIVEQVARGQQDEDHDGDDRRAPRWGPCECSAFMADSRSPTGSSSPEHDADEEWRWGYRRWGA